MAVVSKQYHDNQYITRLDFVIVRDYNTAIFSLISVFLITTNTDI